MRKTSYRSTPMAATKDATNRTIGLDDRLYSYLCEQTLRESELMRELCGELGDDGMR